MKIKLIAAALLLAGGALTVNAQGYKDGVEYYKAARYNNAKVLLERNLNKPGTDKSASYYYLGMIDLRDGKKEAARTKFEQGIAENTNYPYNYVGVGMLELMQGNFKEAEKQFKLAEKRGKKDISSVEIAIARAYYRVNPNLYAKEITKRMEKAYKKDSENPDYYIFKAEQAFEAQDLGNANANFELAYGYAPTTSEAYVRYADVLFERNPEAAIATLRLLLQANPQSALGQRELALALYENKQFAEAAKQYGSYVKNPNHFDRDEDQYSFLLFYGGEYQKGYDYATQLLAKEPDNFTAMRYQFMNAAQLPGLAGKMHAMAEALLAKHNANPKENIFAQIDYTLVADQLTKAGSPNEAIALLDQAIKQYPKATQFIKSKAFAYIDKEDYAKSAEIYKQYIQANPDAGFNDFMQEARLAYYGALTNKESNPAIVKPLIDDINTYCKKAIEADPKQYLPYYFMGQAKLLTASNKDFNSAAVSDYEIALQKISAMTDVSKVGKDGAKICMYLGNYALQSGNKAKAKELFQKALIYDPGNDDVANILKKL